jgi:hypothetical protein
MPRMIMQADEQMTEVLVRSGHNDRQVALAAQRILAKAAEGVIREGILEGDIMSDIFTPMKFNPGQTPEFPLDVLVPGTEKDYAAYTIPNHGRIPERTIEADFVMVPTYDIGSSIDWLLKFSRDARWDIVGRAMQILEATFVRKLNIDAWHALLGAAVDRNVVAYDAAAPAGFLTKRLISVMKTLMRRSGGGNLSSVGQIELTDVWLSPEAMEDIRSWNLTEIDDQTRRRIFEGAGDGGGLTDIYGVNLHELTELGEGQVFQTYFTQLGGTMGAADVEIVLGLDMSAAANTFVMPVRQEIEIFEDETLHRQRRAGYYGWGELGFSVLDNRRVMIGSL